MDTFSHGLMGAVLLSRSGLIGGEKGVPPKGNGQLRIWDWTLAASIFFGVFPDLVSIGLHLIYNVIRYGQMGWESIPAWIFTLYDCTHSLLIAGIVIGVVALRYKMLAVTMAAWPVHILADMFTHGKGKFATPIFFPVSDYKFHGVNWWETPWLSYLPLGILLFLFFGMLVYRKTQNKSCAKALR